jgi:crossover junction endodeoxyribonuclease RusA
MPVETLTFAVPGDPLPKGSAKAFVVQGRARITSTTKGLKGWEQRVALAAPVGIQFHGAVVLRVHFHLTRPKSVKARDHVTKPDLDKLTRAVGDALTGVLYADDKQIVELHVRKDYAEQLPGVTVTVKGNTDAPVQGRRSDRPRQPGDAQAAADPQ